MRLSIALAAGAAVAVGAFVYAAPADAQTSPWRVEQVGRTGIPIAATCDVRRRGEVCAMVWCPRGEMLFSIRGLRRGPNERRGGGAISIDRLTRHVDWDYSETPGGETIWTASLQPPRGFFSNLQRGHQVAVDLGPRRGDLRFSLSGSSRAIGAVERHCYGEYRNQSPAYSSSLGGAALFEVLIGELFASAVDDDDRYDDRRGRGHDDRNLLDQRQIRSIVRDAGYRRIGHIEYRRSQGLYEVQAQGRRGRQVDLRVNAYTGEIVNVDREGRGRRGDRDRWDDDDRDDDDDRGRRRRGGRDDD